MNSSPVGTTYKSLGIERPFRQTAITQLTLNQMSKFHYFIVTIPTRPGN